GAAAIAGWKDAEAVTAWTGNAPASWTLDGGWSDLLLANPSAKPLPIAASFAPLAGAPATLRPGMAEKRFLGASGTLALPVAAPMLLHARTTAPVIAMLRRDGKDEAPVLFPAGAELHRYLPAGMAELRLISPHDGPLSGSLELDATPVTPAGEGLGE